MENRVASSSEGQISVADLVSLFEAAEEASYEARKRSERDRDYHDNIQLTPEELKTLEKRGQPPYIDNRIKTKVDYLVGLEKQQRINPRALPRTPMHEEEAQAATEALNFVADEENFDYKRSAVWRNLLIEGAGGMSVSVEEGYDGIDIKLRRIPWDRMFWDPHASELDFTDAGYLGTVVWMDYDDAISLYPDGKEALEVTMASVQASDTYDDRPKYNLWADKTRRRVRIVQIWIKRGEDWHFAEFTRGGILKAGPSPYKDDKGRSDCELLFQSAYVNRENERFGLVRELISLQDAINKRNSKALHQLNTAQIVVKEGRFSDIEKLRREAARPDGVIVVPDTGQPLLDDFQFNTRTDLAQAQFLLLQEAKSSIDLKGPNATAMGDKAQGSSAASGKAIIASQQGGMVSLGDLLDNLRHLDKRVFRAIWNRIRQFWTAEKWIRVTDDENNVKWVGMNVDPMRAQQLQSDPRTAQMLGGMVQNVAELDCDILIDEAPDSVVPALEQFQALVELKKFDANNEIPFRAVVAAMPNLKDKAQLLKLMDEAKKPNPIKQAAQQLEMAGAQAKVKETESKAMLNMAKAQKEGMPEMGAPPQQPEFELPPEIQVQQALTEMRGTDAAAAHKAAQARKVEVETALMPREMAMQERERRESRMERAAFKRADLDQARRQPAV